MIEYASRSKSRQGLGFRLGSYCAQHGGACATGVDDDDIVHRFSCGLVLRLQICQKEFVPALTLLVYQPNEFVAKLLIGTRNIEDLLVTFYGQSFLRKCRLHL